MVLHIQKTQPHAPYNIVWGVIALMAISAARLLENQLQLLPRCLFHEMTGIPCLTCGATRSLVALSHLDLGSSFMFNPMILIVPLGAMAFSTLVLLGIASKRRLLLQLSETESTFFRVLVLVTIALNWAFLIIVDKV